MKKGERISKIDMPTSMVIRTISVALLCLLNKERIQISSKVLTFCHPLVNAFQVLLTKLFLNVFIM